jgi:hypothetical protein
MLASPCTLDASFTFEITAAAKSCQPNGMRCRPSHRTTLLPFGIAVASFFSTTRLLYYGVMLGTRPYRKRRDLIDDLLVHADERIRKDGTHILEPYPSGQTIWMWCGARKFALRVGKLIEQWSRREPRRSTMHFPSVFGRGQRPRSRVICRSRRMATSTTSMATTQRPMSSSHPSQTRHAVSIAYAA